jgi:hypothetical protein
VSMPNRAQLSRGRGRILGDMEPTPALWRSACQGRVVWGQTPSPLFVATQTTAARVESGSGRLSFEGGDRFSASLAASSARARHQQSAARNRTHQSCQRAPGVPQCPGSRCGASASARSPQRGLTARHDRRAHSTRHVSRRRCGRPGTQSVDGGLVARFPRPRRLASTSDGAAPLGKVASGGQHRSQESVRTPAAPGCAWGACSTGCRR